MDDKKIFHLYLISDSTGETINTVARSVCAHFKNIRPVEHSFGLIRSDRQLNRVLEFIEKEPGPVFFSIVDYDLTVKLKTVCIRLNIPCISVLDSFVNTLGEYLGTEAHHQVGRQHVLTEEYFDRMRAINFTIAHDDGQGVSDLHDAEIIIVGVSRTSKTPTCMYLANRGIKVANIPFILEVDLPDILFNLKNLFVVGLTITATRLIEIRKNRLLYLKEKNDTNYINSDVIKFEIMTARKFFNQMKWPIIDVSRRSIEETSATILNLYQHFKFKNKD